MYFPTRMGFCIFFTRLSEINADVSVRMFPFFPFSNSVDLAAKLLAYNSLSFKYINIDTVGLPSLFKIAQLFPRNMQFLLTGRK